MQNSKHRILLILTVLHIFHHPSFFQLRFLSVSPPPPAQSLTSFLPATLYISADQSRSSL